MSFANDPELAWCTCGAKKPLLCYLRDKGLLSPRKQVLLAYASIGPAAPQDPYYELAARFVDGKASQAEIEAALLALQREEEADPYFSDTCHNTHADVVNRHRNLLKIACGQANIVDIDAHFNDNPFSPSEGMPPQDGIGVFLIHELFGDPTCAVGVDDSTRLTEEPAVVEAMARRSLRTWQSWNEGAIVRLAQEMYEAADFRRMPALADALQKAGCDDAIVLGHCLRSPLHVRGCWVLDLLLGKEQVGAVSAAAANRPRG
jgi:hypothetical protein